VIINFRTVLLLFVAFSAAGGAALFARNWIAGQQAALQDHVSAPARPAEIVTTEVLVAARDLPTGSFLRSEHLKWQAWPRDAVRAEYIVRGKGREQDLEGAVARSRVSTGEPVTAVRVVHPGERGFLAAVLEPGKRAISVPVDATTGISGFIFPADYVDVLLTFRYAVNDSSNGGGHPRHYSETLLRNVRVLAVDQRVENEDGAAKVAKTATLEVTSRQAEKVALGLQLGSVSLSLRSLAAEPDDGSGFASTAASTEETDRSYTRDVDIYYMLDDSWGANDAVGEARKVQILRGSSAELVRF
jgi:pilus assembly protein CpaB